MLDEEESDDENVEENVEEKNTQIPAKANMAEEKNRTYSTPERLDEISPREKDKHL